jgi:hypothetical protein
MKTLGDIVSFVVSALHNVTVKPPVGAPCGRHTRNGTVCPTCTTTLSCSPIVIWSVTCTDREAETYPGAEAVKVTEPMSLPVTRGSVTGVVAPAGMKTLAGDTLTSPILVLLKEMVTPPVGAGTLRLTGRGPEEPHCPMIMKAGSCTAGGLITVTVAVVSANMGRLLAWMTADPNPAPDTGTLVVEEFAAKVTVAGTDATLGLLELTFTVRPPAGAGAESARVRDGLVPWVMAKVADWNPSVPVTATCWLAGVNPDAEALIVAIPKVTPVTCGALTG